MSFSKNPWVKFFVSLRLTVVLLILSIILVFCATLNQVQLGVWGVQAKWFRSFFVWQNMKGILIPVFPGGYLIGGLLLINLVAAHLYRFKLSWRKSGIFITHAGLILLLIGELVTALFQKEYQMRLDEGETKRYSESPRYVELAVIEVSDPKWDAVTAIPSDHLRSQKTIRRAELPFSITPLYYYPNTALRRNAEVPDGPPSGADQGIGAGLKVYNIPVTYRDDQRNLPGALVQLDTPDGTLGRWFLSPWLIDSQRISYKGHTFELSLRFQRAYKNFSLTLLKFTHDRYPGTDIPKNFSSRLRLHNWDTGEDREVLVYMNNPLRYEGLTFYQQGFDNNDTTTILQVVRNPGWLIPYISCLMLAFGLLVQFGISLFTFSKKRRTGTASRPASAQRA